MTKAEIRAYRHDYYVAHQEDAKAHSMAYCAAHKEELAAYHKNYYAAHQEQLLDYAKAHRTTYREQHRAYSKAYADAHPEEIKVRRKLYYAEHRAELIAAGKAYQSAHREEIKAYRKAYRLAHPRNKDGTSHQFRKCCGAYPTYKTDGGYSILYCKKCGRTAKSRKVAQLRSLWNYLLNNGLKRREQSLAEKRKEAFAKKIISISQDKTDTEKIMEEFKKKDKEQYLESLGAV